MQDLPQGVERPMAGGQKRTAANREEGQEAPGAH